MDAHHFDRLVKRLSTRRSVLGLVAGIGVLLGVGPDEAEAKCKKKCGPCRRCKKGKCKPKRGSPRCGPCSTCHRGRCVAQCSPDDCVPGDEGAFCLKECPTACDTCSRCDRIEGQCEPICEPDQCIDDFCRVPCETPCGECSVCDFGECFALCPEGVACVNGRCDTPCTTACFADEECIGGECFPVCNPPCEDDQGCVEGSGGNTCVDLAGSCSSEEHVCFAPGAETCSAGSGFGRCVTLADGGSYCAQGISCSVCESDLDCQSYGFGPNSRCVTECEFCFGNGGSGCVRFAADQD